MFSRPTLAIDCGASRTALGVFSRQGGRMRLLEMAVAAFPASTGQGDDWLVQTRQALQALRQQTKTSGPATLILPAHLVLTKFLKVPNVGSAQRGKIIRFEAGQSIPYPLADVVWDSVVTGGGDFGLAVMLAAARLDAVEPLCAAVEAAGFEPRFLLPSPLATFAGYRLVHPAPTESVLILNLGARSATLLLAGTRCFVARTFPLGGNGPADTLKEPAGGAGEALATRLAQEIARSLMHFRRHIPWDDPVRVGLTGGGARRDGLAEALTVRLKIPVGWLDVLGAIETGRGPVGDIAAEHAFTIIDLIGAAAIQLRPDQRMLNLLPPLRRRWEELRHRQPWLAAAALLAVTAMIPPLLQQRNLTQEVRRKTAAIEREIAPLREREVRNSDRLRQLGELRRQIDRLQGAFDRRTGWLSLLADLQDRLVRVEDVWFEKLAVLPAEAGAPVRLAVSGCMLARTNPQAKAGTETVRRVKALLASIGDSPFVSGIESERFDHEQPGILRFDFVLVTDPRRPL